MLEITIKDYTDKALSTVAFYQSEEREILLAKFNEYRRITYFQKAHHVITKAIRDMGIAYCTIGLADEIAELQEVAINLCDEVIECEGYYDIASFNKRIAKEMGDVLWYFCVLFNRINFDLSKTLLILGETLSDYQEVTKLSCDICKDDNDLLFMNLTTRLNVVSGKIMGIMKKRIRKSADDFEEEKINELQTLAIDFIVIYSRILNIFNLSFEKVAVGNNEKLALRKELNLIEGNGDNREEVK